jgi:hypothetical protein
VSTKKQKTPIKSNVKTAIVGLAEEAKEAKRLQELAQGQVKMEEEFTPEVASPILDPKTLMGTPTEARQEQ